MVKPKYEHSILEHKEVIRRYKEATRGRPILGKDDLIVNYKKNRIVNTRLVEAPWSYVIGISLSSAILIAMFKLTFFHFFGKPQIFPLGHRAKIQQEAAIAAQPPISHIREQIKKIN